MPELKGCGCVVILCIAVTILLLAISEGSYEGALIAAAGAIVFIIVMWLVILDQ